MRKLMNLILPRRRRMERDLERELRYHVDRRARDLAESGLSEAEARRQAAIEFGGVAQIQEEVRDTWWWRWLHDFGRDLRYATRVLSGSPAFTATAVLSLALGIGANTSIFTLMDTVLLRLLPLREPRQLYFLAHGEGERISTSANYRLLEHYRTNTEVFSGIAAFTTSEFKVRTGDGIELVMGQFASGNYYELLGVSASLGRGFRYESETTREDNFRAVISDAYWSRRFGRDPDVLGKTLVVDGQTVSIVGVTHPELFGLYPGLRMDITIPMAMKAVLGGPDWFTSIRSWRSMPLVARLRPDVSAEQARTSTDLLFRQFVDAPELAWVKERPEQFAAAALLPASQGLSDLRKKYSKPLFVLMSMVALVLLIACANVANLLLGRATARSKEIAVRLSIGAGRGRIARQLFTESLLLALLGGAAGFFAAVWATQSLIATMATGRYPMQLHLQWDARVFLFALVVCFATAILFGLAPAIRGTRVDLTPALKESAATGASSNRWNGGKALVVAQVALCALLLSGTGLLVRSLHNLRTQNTGFDTENVLLVSVDTSGARLTPARRIQDELLGRIERFPGVVSASYSTLNPLGSHATVRRVDVPGFAADDRRQLSMTSDHGGAWANIVSPRYFQTLGIRLLRGRDFSEQDRAPERVAIVNEKMARFYFDDLEVIGRQFVFSSLPDEPWEIVGVVEDTMQQNLRDEPPRMVYTPWRQEAKSPPWFTAEVRASGDLDALAGVVRSEIRAFDQDLVVQHLRTMSEEADAKLVQERLLASLSTAFGGLALLLACIGLYGVMGYSVVRRTREMGIRMALGAARGVVLWQVLRESLWLVVSGIVVGVPMALLAAPAVGDLLYELSPGDPAVFLASAALLVAVAAFASYLPARRASRIEPTVALRHE